MRSRALAPAILTSLTLALALALVTAHAAAQDEPPVEPAPVEPAQPAPPAPAPPAPPAPEYGPPAPPPPPPPVAVPPVEPPPPPSPPRHRAPRFGEAGEKVFTADSSVGLSLATYSESDAKHVRVGFSPGFDYFAIRGFSIGVDVTLDYDFTRLYGDSGRLVDTTTTTVGAGPRIGFNFPIGDSLSFYPRLTVGLDSVQQDSTYPSSSPLSAPTTSSSSRSGAYVVLFTPLLLHPAPHFFIGAGPGVFTELGGMGTGNTSLGGERTTLFARLVVGTWWGGTPEPVADAAEPPPARERHATRFGDADTWVLSGELGADVSSSTYGDSKATRTTYSLSPSFDYFVAEHFSFGLGAALSHTGSSTGGVTNGSDDVVAAVARLGVDFPIASALSLYPRASLLAGHLWHTEKSLAREDTIETTAIAVGLSVPLLVHVADHAFIGFGPDVTRNLKNSTQGTARDNLVTALGAHLLVGGWLSR